MSIPVMLDHSKILVYRLCKKNVLAYCILPGTVLGYSGAVTEIIPECGKS